MEQPVISEEMQAQIQTTVLELQELFNHPDTTIRDMVKHARANGLELAFGVRPFSQVIDVPAEEVPAAGSFQ